MDKSYLIHRRILITRAKEQAKEMEKVIESRGGIPVTCPVLSFHTLPCNEKQKVLLKGLSHFDWVVFTSANAIHSFFEYIRQEEIPFPAELQTAVVGKKTAEISRSYGISPQLIPINFNSQSLVEAFENQVQTEGRILIPMGQLAKTDLHDSLVAKGFQVTPWVIYETVPERAYQEQITSLFDHQEVDVLTFTSPSSVRFFIDIVSESHWEEKNNQFVIACIGITTAQELLNFGRKADIIPEVSTTYALVQAIEAYYKEDASCHH